MVGKALTARGIFSIDRLLVVGGKTMGGVNEYSDDSDSEFQLDEEVEVDTFIDAVEGTGKRRREPAAKRTGALHRLERRRDRNWLRDQLSDWDDYD